MQMLMIFRFLILRVFSSNLAHLSLVFFWLAGMHFHGAYFSNYDIYLKDPKHYLPTAHLVWGLIGQDILNSDISQSHLGIRLKYGCSAIYCCSENWMLT